MADDQERERTFDLSTECYPHVARVHLWRFLEAKELELVDRICNEPDDEARLLVEQLAELQFLMMAYFPALGVFDHEEATPEALCILKYYCRRKPPPPVKSDASAARDHYGVMFASIVLLVILALLVFAVPVVTLWKFRHHL